MAASGYWCPANNVSLTTTYCNASTIIPASGVSNCLGGLSNGTTAAGAQCQICTNSSYYLNGTAAGNGGCIANNASCIT